MLNVSILTRCGRERIQVSRHFNKHFNANLAMKKLFRQWVPQFEEISGKPSQIVSRFDTIRLATFSKIRRNSWNHISDITGAIGPRWQLYWKKIIFTSFHTFFQFHSQIFSIEPRKFVQDWCRFHWSKTNKVSQEYYVVYVTIKLLLYID